MCNAFFINFTQIMENSDEIIYLEDGKVYNKAILEGII